MTHNMTNNDNPSIEDETGKPKLKQPKGKEDSWWSNKE